MAGYGFVFKAERFKGAYLRFFFSRKSVHSGNHSQNRNQQNRCQSFFHLFLPLMIQNMFCNYIDMYNYVVFYEHDNNKPLLEIYHRNL